MNPARILLVEDDESLAMVVRDALDRDGWQVDAVRDGPSALEKARARRYDLIVLDLMIPGVDGYEVCRRLKAEGNGAQILMCTARGREEDRIQGLDLGADDYVVKPFSLKELLARVRARIRSKQPRTAERVAVGRASVDFAAMTVLRDGETHALTKMEAGVLKLLIADAGRVVTRGRFLDEVWGYDRHPTTRTVDMHVARVREKLGDTDEHSRLIHTVHGVGYRLDLPKEATDVAGS
jgi:DNA-binding response OmpR family regulator